VILLAEHDEPSLAAKKKQRHVALKTATSTPKNRVWNFFGSAPGRISCEAGSTPETATGSVQYSYENASGRAYYYTRDHLGSVREMTNSSGTIVARYSYDPYGRTTLVSGSDMATKQYAGMMKHQASGLYLTPFGNTYDPNTGRWIGRDPLGEGASLNLYAYCANEPIDTNDPLGLDYHLHNDIHQWVTVDDGNGGHHTYSFDNPSYPAPDGPGKWFQDGTLDQDMAHKYPSATTTDYHSTPEQDAALNKAFQDKVKAQAERYNLFDVNGSNCRKASDDVIDKTLGPKAWQPAHHYGPVTLPHGGRKGWGQID
jgi:RHS repeat-associated protein